MPVEVSCGSESRSHLSGSQRASKTPPPRTMKGRGDKAATDIYDRDAHNCHVEGKPRSPEQLGGAHCTLGYWSAGPGSG